MSVRHRVCSCNQPHLRVSCRPAIKSLIHSSCCQCANLGRAWTCHSRSLHCVGFLAHPSCGVVWSAFISFGDNARSVLQRCVPHVRPCVLVRPGMAAFATDPCARVTTMFVCTSVVARKRGNAEATGRQDFASRAQRRRSCAADLQARSPLVSRTRQGLRWGYRAHVVSSAEAMHAMEGAS